MSTTATTATTAATTTDATTTDAAIEATATTATSAVNDGLDDLSWRQLRDVVRENNIGPDPKWRNNAKSSEFIAELRKAGIVAPTTSAATPAPAAGAAAPAAKATGKTTTPISTVDGLIHPTIDKTFIMPEKTRKLFDVQLSVGQNSNHAPNVLMVGPAGCGKTEMAYQFAAYAGLPVLKVNCPLVREPRDWFGYKTAEDGNVRWVRSQFAKAVEAGGVVILLDEITRAAPPILNSLLPLLDGTRESFIEEVKEVLKVGKEVYFFATANIGAQFTGAYGKIDAALMDRFDYEILCTYLEADKEAKLLQDRTGVKADTAKKLVRVAQSVRQHNGVGGQLTETVSTRTLLATAKLYAQIGADAFEFTILPRFNDDGGTQSERAQVLQILQGQFGPEMGR